MILVLLIVFVVVLIGYTLQTAIKPKGFPPGPKWYPFMGCSNLVEKMTKKHGSQWKAFSALAKEYSTEVLGLKLGSELVVVVYGMKNIHRVFTEKEFEGRPNSFFIKLRCFGKRMGITSSDGALWKEYRQFTVKHLRNVGFGKTAMEKEIQSEMCGMVNYIKNNNDKPISPRNLFATAVMNVLWKYVAGERIKEERLKLLLDLLSVRSKAFSMSGGWLNQMPWIRFFFPEMSGYSLITKVNEQLSDIIEEAINKHKNKTIVANDFIYSFMNEMKTNKETYTEEQLKVICLDLLIAGSQTTSNVLEFAFLMVLRNKGLQEKVYDEINTVLGSDMPCWADNSRLVYTSAFILEVQRFYTIAPLVGPRRVLSDTKIEDYLIRKDTTVLISTGDLHLDQQLWDDPYDFKPERFIDDKGMLKNNLHLYTFGSGRRRCPGDSLAKSFIFIFFVGILQQFRIECTNGVLPSGEPHIGLISSPKAYTADFIARN